MTERHYTDARLLDLWEETRKLPAVPRAAESASLKATGTDGKALEGQSRPTLPAAPTRARVGGNPVALPVALSSGRRGVNVASSGRMAGSVTNATQGENTGKKPRFSHEIALRAVGLEPTTAGLKGRCSTD